MSMAVLLFPKNTAPRRDRAFTLLELLVVVGLMVLLSAGIGFSLGDSGGNSLASAQKTLAGLVGTARAQAAVHQTEARLLIYASRPPSGDAEKFLRLLQVFRAEPAGSGNWVPVGSPVYLPRGIFLVPPSTAGLLAGGIVWPSDPAPVSTVDTDTAPGEPGSAFNGASVVYYLEFAPDGTLTPSTGRPRVALALATAATVNGLPQFNNPGAVRGLLLRTSGAIGFANDAAGF